MSTFPTRQRDLLLAARGSATQASFARQLGVDRSCLSRYEQEKLGAPVVVLNECLRLLAEQLAGPPESTGIEQALSHVRLAAQALEQAAKIESQNLRRRARRATSQGRREPM